MPTAAFLACLGEATAANRPVSDASRAENYAPKLFARTPKAKAEGLTKEDLARAMEALFSAGEITMQSYGKPSAGTRKIIRALGAGNGSAGHQDGDKNGDRQSVAVVPFDEVEIDLDRSFCIGEMRVLLTFMMRGKRRRLAAKAASKAAKGAPAPCLVRSTSGGKGASTEAEIGRPRQMPHDTEQAHRFIPKSVDDFQSERNSSRPCEKSG